MSEKPTRRQFLAASGAGVGWLTLATPSLLALGNLACTAKDKNAAFVTFTGREAADFQALTAQIIPSGETPGAKEAGVVYFADLALANPGQIAGMLEPIREGLNNLDNRARQDGASFADLPSDAQQIIIRELEETPFFGMARALTLFGMFAHPKYGGNKDKLGWELIGFVDQHGWQPPFGFYDKDYDYEANYRQVNS